MSLAGTQACSPHSWVTNLPQRDLTACWSYTTEICQVLQSPESMIQANSMLMEADLESEYTL